jgi:hypothetical protein
MSGAPPHAAAGGAVPATTLDVVPMPLPVCLADEAWLYNAPAFHSAVVWSDDNVLAVAAGTTVVLVSPADLGGARHYVALPQPAAPTAAQLKKGSKPAEDKEPAAGCRPRRAAASATLPLAMLAEGDGGAVLARAVAWSPAGCAPGAGCLLAVLSSDHKVSKWTGTCERMLGFLCSRKTALQ